MKYTILAALGATVSATCHFGRVDSFSRYFPAYENAFNECDADDDNDCSIDEWYDAMVQYVDPKNLKLFDRKFDEIIPLADFDNNGHLDSLEIATLYYCMNVEDESIFYAPHPTQHSGGKK